MIVPVFMVPYTPVEGRAAREFGNEYTRMFCVTWDTRTPGWAKKE